MCPIQENPTVHITQIDGLLMFFSLTILSIPSKQRKSSSQVPVIISYYYHLIWKLVCRHHLSVIPQRLSIAINHG